MNTFLLNLAYIVASVLFIFGIKRLASPATATRANYLSMGGMALAIVVTLLDDRIVWDYYLVIVGCVAVAGAGIGMVVARTVQMTAMPELVAMFNGFGGMASLLVAGSELATRHPADAPLAANTSLPIALAIVIGGVTFSGSMVAYLKLSERLAGAPMLFRGQQVVNGLLLATILLAVAGLVVWGQQAPTAVVVLLVAVALVFGVMAVLPIGGADMPVVISLLNSYSGLAASAAGFVINNNLLIVAGAMVGASGMVLTNVMCRAMNRSLANVLFSGFGAAASASAATAKAQGEVKDSTVGDAWAVLEAANFVVFVPGYGMAVAQAQHLVYELAQLLEANGAEVKYAIHPVAGRMPGHMNVLLAEANVPYEQLVEPDAINPIIESADVCIVIGANDVVNPAAREEKGSPIYGMPVIEVDRSRTVFVLKRSMASGFAGIDNPLFFKTNTRMLFGDAKETLSKLVAEFKDS